MPMCLVTTGTIGLHFLSIQCLFIITVGLLFVLRCLTLASDLFGLCSILWSNESLFHSLFDVCSIPRCVWYRSIHILKITLFVASTFKITRFDTPFLHVSILIFPFHQTRESRTVTHFQYLTWTSLGAPSMATPLLEFRRKVNKAASHPQIPLLVHCSGGVGRTGTYMLIDMALTRIQSGTGCGLV